MLRVGSEFPLLPGDLCSALADTDARRPGAGGSRNHLLHRDRYEPDRMVALAAL